ncbi:MAG: alpha/beta hydrolase [Gammaproteobacteria bacterium]|nr:alpha/beta hydrolase [Gammaproteobacteria bacterium]MBU0788004.1 alpha/beta hydrolase [Gammaproteobacteria bacterium]MBU0815498.1 alpha/beta hydrolase [Gammaproteobacteria bacterium]MBU1785394.1 alpha/beta hydrolase [Gammaproteobacteria bacterium]
MSAISRQAGSPYAVGDGGLAAGISFAEIDWAGRQVRIEYQWVGPAAAFRAGNDEAGMPEAPWLVFLHEGLGSLSMWRDFPARLCAALGCRGLVYSRPGYGRSTPRAANESWGADFMHRQAHEVLPALLGALGCDSCAAPWLLGHSDGGSIALLYAARYPLRVSGAIVLAPHILVEQVSVDSIARTRKTYLETDLRVRLARHHADPDSAFWGWNDIWLAPAFRHWSIAEEIATITCPLLAVQGLDDEYGTLAQIDGIARCVPQTQGLELAHCGHSPHRDQADSLIAACTSFIQRSQKGDIS